ncbi:MAG: type transport system ATP-binding protein [Acidimicrobiaceae bacterium]
MTLAIETRDLTRSFGDAVALDGLTLEVEPGEVLALLGPNGAGKTTTVRLLNGVLKAERGEARVLGLDPASDADEVRRRTGVLTENAGLDERLTARENLLFTARVRGMGRAASSVKADELLERFGMADKANLMVQGFSTGQRKRLALARALLHDPDVLFLDEPTSGLDPAATRDVVDLIASLAQDHGRTVILCTHFLGEAGRLAHRMAVLHLGKLRAFGRPEELAAELWDGIEADLDLDGPAESRMLDAIRAVRGVLEVTATTDGATVRVRDRKVLPVVVAALVGREVPVYAAVPRPPTLEDVYFAVEARTLAEEAERAAR